MARGRKETDLGTVKGFRVGRLQQKYSNQYSSPSESLISIPVQSNFINYATAMVLYCLTMVERVCGT